MPKGCMISTHACRPWLVTLSELANDDCQRPYEAITASQQMPLMITRGYDTYMYDNSPNGQCNPIELFLRGETKERIHMDSTLTIIVLASHDKRTHRDIWGISSLDILGGQI